MWDSRSSTISRALWAISGIDEGIYGNNIACSQELCGSRNHACSLWRQLYVAWDKTECSRATVNIAKFCERKVQTMISPGFPPCRNLCLFYITLPTSPPRMMSPRATWWEKMRYLRPFHIFLPWIINTEGLISIPWLSRAITSLSPPNIGPFLFFWSSAICEIHCHKLKHFSCLRSEIATGIYIKFANKTIETDFKS